ncbi:hypothetical protein G6F37_009412 [Rhizopus arrhizus]|nr:hypothetical protein G6F38_006883 [Rhizopus arrhizus]KAG1154479.1 hypothetical protein G6F37_009412 [Rhizopus arrhizus]
MAKVLKDMAYSLYLKSPDALHELAFIGFLLFDTKITMMVCDSAAGYVCRSNHTKTVELPEEADDICNELLPILKAVHQSRLMMENTNKLVKQKPTDIDDDIDHYKTILPSLLVKEKVPKTIGQRDTEGSWHQGGELPYGTNSSHFLLFVEEMAAAENSDYIICRLLIDRAGTHKIPKVLQAIHNLGHPALFLFISPYSPMLNLWKNAGQKLRSSQDIS